MYLTDIDLAGFLFLTESFLATVPDERLPGVVESIAEVTSRSPLQNFE